MPKIWLQISFDSAQWQFDCAGQAQWDGLIKNRIENIDGLGRNITYGYNRELESPYLKYFNTGSNTYNVILYEDSLSVKAKIDLAKAYRLGGISFWSLGNIPDFSDKKGKNII